MSQKFKLSLQHIRENVNKIQKILSDEKFDGIYISSFDEFINEYVPMIDCHRYYVTGFSGSTAEAFVPKNGKVKLYVDGRYHEQADLECDLSLVEVIKVPHHKSILDSLKEDLKNLGYKRIACEAKRTTVGFYKYLNQEYELSALEDHPIFKVFEFQNSKKLNPIKQLSDEICGLSVKSKLQLISKDSQQAYYINAIDSLSWLTNCRGYHLPYLSSFLGRGIAVKEKVYVFISAEVDVVCDDSSIEFIILERGVLEKTLKAIISEFDIKEFIIDENMLNASDYLLLLACVGERALIQKKGGLVEFHAIKNLGEIGSIKDSFKKADQAIFKTISWVKESLKNKSILSERDIYNKAFEMYKTQGANELSFGTIVGVDANGSIIHYGDPKESVKVQDTSMVLMDSGGYFESGFATDTTRTFMASDQEGSPKHKEIYTLVLKGLLAVQNAVFKTNTGSSGLDAICRQPLYQKGYDYAHGTGHGVGIHVHEGGASISTTRQEKMIPGQVVSMEPGIYIPGFGGVRLENIALVIDHPEFAGFLKFEPLVYIGFEPLLIDDTLLTAQEKGWLADYEKICEERGTSFFKGSKGNI